MCYPGSSWLTLYFLFEFLRVNFYLHIPLYISAIIASVILLRTSLQTDLGAIYYHVYTKVWYSCCSCAWIFFLCWYKQMHVCPIVWKTVMCLVMVVCMCADRYSFLWIYINPYCVLATVSTVRIFLYMYLRLNIIVCFYVERFK